ncbi:MAG: hypothetical protein U0821_27235 [Chloroflexota bacterium]
MHRIAIELPIVAAASAVIAGMVLIAGTALDRQAQATGVASRAAGATSGDPETCLVAPVTAASAIGVIGQSVLCYDGRDLRATLVAHDLAPGQLYNTWLRYEYSPAPCTDSPCGQIDLPNEGPTGLLELMGGEVAPPSRRVEVRVELRGVHLVRGALLTLSLAHADGADNPVAQAAFTIR